MATRYGPADLYVIGFPQQRIPEQVTSALTGALAGGAVTVLDFTLVRKLPGGALEIVEWQDLGDQVDVAVVNTDTTGIIGDEDVDEIASSIPEGTSALIVLFEHTWARGIAGALQSAGASVLRTERFSSDVVNEVADLAMAAS